MKRFNKSAITNVSLEPMPIDDEDILDGEPQARGEILFNSEDHKFYCGIWECTRGKFLYTYDDAESCYILQGEASVRSDSGTMTVKKGDLVYFRRGLDTIWTVKRKIKKIFFVYEK